MVPDAGTILHYFGRIHSRRGAGEIELQVMQGVVGTVLNFPEETQQRRERWGFLHLEAVRIRQRRRE
jgi:hypothetical protein